MTYDEVVSSYDQNIEFIVGFAGSGKSTELANRWTKDVLTVVPTHASAKVLIAKGLENVFTIHSVLGLVPTLNHNFYAGQKIQTLTKIGETDLSEITTIFLDEFSLINTDIFEMLLAVLPKHCDVKVFGDPFQLPPVDGQPILYDDYATSLTKLENQYRAEAPEVVETFMRLVDYIDKPHPSKSLRLNPLIKNGSLANFNPDTDRAVAYTNAKVIEMNLEIADILGYEPEIAVGEPIIVNNCILTELIDGVPELRAYPKCIAKGHWLDMDDLTKASMKCASDLNKFRINLDGYATRHVEIDGVVATIHVDFDHYQNNKLMVDEIEKWQTMVRNGNNLGSDVNLAQWCKQNRSGLYVSERGKAWSAKINHDAYVFDVRRPFATTVHRAQGQEFTTVYVAQSDIKKAIRGGYYVMYARLLYVALSRAIMKVVIVP